MRAHAFSDYYFFSLFPSSTLITVIPDRIAAYSGIYEKRYIPLHYAVRLHYTALEADEARLNRRSKQARAVRRSGPLLSFLFNFREARTSESAARIQTTARAAAFLQDALSRGRKRVVRQHARLDEA